MKKIFIDPGHGGQDPGAVGNGLREKDLNLQVALRVRNILNEKYSGHSIRMSRTTDKTVSLRERTNMANAWGADYLVSIHTNAGGGTGFESFIYNGSYANKTETNRLRSIIHDEVVKSTKFRDRGKKEANFHMLRESTMPAVLTENGFIDNIDDAKKLRTTSFLQQIAEGHAIGIAKALQLPAKKSVTYYRVITGSFLKRQNAVDRVIALKKIGYSSFIIPFHLNGQTFHRVVTGSFVERANAQRRVEQLKQKGFQSFIDIYIDK